MADAAAYDPLGTAGTWRRNRAKLVVYALLSLFALYYVLPLCVVVLNSFRDLPDISRNGLIGLPHSFSLEYWSAAWNQFCVGGTCKGIEPFFFNSVAMVGAGDHHLNRNRLDQRLCFVEVALHRLGNSCLA